MNFDPTVSQDEAHQRGIRLNVWQFFMQTLQVVFVGLTLGTERTVLPALSADFGVSKGAFLWLASFVIAFGFVKGLVNFAAGTMADRIGRKRVLLLGWLAALPIPFLLLYAQSWGWVVIANVFLGISQGLAWSVTVISMVDLARTEQRGLAVGINEFGGYAAMGVAGLTTGVLATAYGPRVALFGFSLGVILLAALTTLWFVRETLGFAHAESRAHREGRHDGPKARIPQTRSEQPGAWEIFLLVSFRHPTLRALSQAGVINKVADTLVWILFPIYLHQRGLGLIGIGWITGVYAAVWGISQLWSGPLSDRIGRKWLIASGLWLLALGILGVLLLQGLTLWLAAAALMGTGMAMLYPNIIAAVNDISDPHWRGASLGAYRYWRDTGYAIGGLLLGWVAQASHHVVPAFWTTIALLLISGAWVAFGSEETHPRINPAPTPNDVL
ncbi:MFS transporter [Acidihalobacter yilgarnensis]|uniref:MFS transporter n=1 Tax=Acidihalobacter yilgarnensis TaxID=2819280 RepID=A0A1D8IQS5_9GAMM|nr:MFS transporter [Acidihalobacter yilgarnensis]AOU98830.1 MFS transporter [Acidihalobacter yilgarnensis]